MTPTPVITPAPAQALDVSGHTIGQLQKLLDGTVETPPVAEPEPVADAPTEAEPDKEPKPSEIADPEKKDPAVESPSPESEPGKDTEKPTEGDPTSKKGISKRFSKLISTIRDLEDRLASQPAAGAPEKSGPASPASVTEPATAKKPALEDFSNYEDFNEALVDWKVDQREQAKQRETAAAKVAEAERAVRQSWQEQIAKVTEDDWEEVVSQAALPMTPAIQEAIMTADHGTAIVYHLAKHPEEARALSAMTPVAAVRAIGKLEAKFSQPPVVVEPPKPKAQPALPKPPVAVGGKSSPKGDDFTAPDVPMDEFKRLVNTQLRPRNRF